MRSIELYKYALHDYFITMINCKYKSKLTFLQEKLSIIVGFFFLQYFFSTTEDLSDAYKRLKHLIMEYLGMSPPSTVHSDLFSSSITSVDTSQSEETLHQADKSGTSQTTSVTVNVAARTWSRRSGSSTIHSKGVKLTQHKTPVVCVFVFLFLLRYSHCIALGG